ncbi:MAG: hypothetical protein RI601_05425 [Desulfurivibrionaceae bacterium]|nr:hypothetical protein [Desulfurivibrionaceae bacterium]
MIFGAAARYSLSLHPKAFLVTACRRSPQAQGFRGLDFTPPGWGAAFILFLATLLWLPAPLSAATAHHLQRQGVEAYNEGRHEEALDLFSQAVARNPADAAALYNQGTALYKMGQSTEAAQAFGAAAQLHSEPEPRARALYNKGRALLAAAGRAPDQAQKKKLLLDGNQAFQQALRTDKNLTAARQGIEDFRSHYAQLRQQPSPPPAEKGDQRNQNDQEDQGDQGQGLQEQLANSGRQQQEMAAQSKAANSGSSREGVSQQQLAEMAAQQQSVRQTLEKVKDGLEKKAPNQKESGQETPELTEQLAEAISRQKKAETALQQGDLGQALSEQQQAADRLQETAAALAADQKEQPAAAAGSPGAESSQDAAAKESAPAASRPGEKGPDQQAAQEQSSVAAILDGEKALHEMRRLRRQQQRPASGKDW